MLPRWIYSYDMAFIFFYSICIQLCASGEDCRIFSEGHFYSWNYTFVCPLMLVVITNSKYFWQEIRYVSFRMRGLCLLGDFVLMYKLLISAALVSTERCYGGHWCKTALTGHHQVPSQWSMMPCYPSCFDLKTASSGMMQTIDFSSCLLVEQCNFCDQLVKIYGVHLKCTLCHFLVWPELFSDNSRATQENEKWKSWWTDRKKSLRTALEWCCLTQKAMWSSWRHAPHEK